MRLKYCSCCQTVNLYCESSSKMLMYNILTGYYVLQTLIYLPGKTKKYLEIVTMWRIR